MKNNVRKWLIFALNDPIIKMLAENSNLTKIQLESLLIDFLGEKISGKSLNMEEKAKLRLSKAGTSRGAYNRTLRQARRNVIQSIYTIFLLGCLGVFESTRLDPYLEVANKLQTYMNAYRGIQASKEAPSEHLRVIDMLRRELETALEHLSRPRAFSEV